VRRNGFRNFFRGGLLIACCVASMMPRAASAKPLPIIFNMSAQTVAAISSATKVCVYVTYDKNGNRLTQNVGSVTTNQTLWGAGTYGCFDWKA
jgi:hypothetical protein